jgi:pyruvate carboxylase
MRVVEKAADLGPCSMRRRRGGTRVRQFRGLPRAIHPRAKHIEVQVLGDNHGNVLICTSAIARCSAATRRSSRSRPRWISSRARELCDAAARMAREIGYDNAGTVEFLSISTATNGFSSR